MREKLISEMGGNPESDAWSEVSPLAHQYGVYGITLRSQIRLALPEYPCAGLAEIELRMRGPSFFSEAVSGTPLKSSRFSTYQYAHLKNGSSYVRWDDVGEFLVSSDGRLITCGHLNNSPGESFQVYLLGQALSFALVRGGFEPFHATCVVVNGAAVAFLGDSGFGKSSLAAYFLNAGDRLLTDDLLLLQERPEGFLAYPGPPRIKLLPDMANKFLGGVNGGVPMNPQTPKLILPLAPERICDSPVFLRAVYELSPPHDMKDVQTVEFESLTTREAFVELSCNTFNYVILDGDRVHRQFTETARIANAVPMKRLIHPRSLESLPLVREEILEDLRRAAPNSTQ
ncbi:MAG TPA: hypothetical protein VGZ48_10545 [Candidatus Acidoferrales bacterium]|jgi:hypothetical protein|nr:hypothetical protein [Candidatus Acidoferrales bacterium]